MKCRYIIIISLILPVVLSSCQTGWSGEARDFRQDMRNFVSEISAYSHNNEPDFIIIPQNGHEILTLDGSSSGTIAADYTAAIDGLGREDLFYGYNQDDEATPAAEQTAMLGFMNLAEANGIEVLTTDYCSTASKIEDSYSRNAARGFISFAADSRDLDRIPSYPPVPYDVNAGSAAALSEAENFLYLINPSAYNSKTAYLNALDATNYDLIIMDLFFEDNSGTPAALTVTDLTPLKTKANGGSRLLLCYMSIGEAEDYRYYWESNWKPGSPEWIAEENSAWRGNYKVEYWAPEWQAVIFGNANAYLDRIIAAGFDGVYLDIIDAYEYFEEALGL